MCLADQLRLGSSCLLFFCLILTRQCGDASLQIIWHRVFFGTATKGLCILSHIFFFKSSVFKSVFNENSAFASPVRYFIKL